MWNLSQTWWALVKATTRLVTLVFVTGIGGRGEAWVDFLATCFFFFFFFLICTYMSSTSPFDVGLYKALSQVQIEPQTECAIQKGATRLIELFMVAEE